MLVRRNVEAASLARPGTNINEIETVSPGNHGFGFRGTIMYNPGLLEVLVLTVMEQEG